MRSANLVQVGRLPVRRWFDGERDRSNVGEDPLQIGEHRALLACTFLGVRDRRAQRVELVRVLLGSSLGVMLIEGAQACGADGRGLVQVRNRISDELRPPARRGGLGLRHRDEALDLDFPLHQRVDDAIRLQVPAQQRAGNVGVRAQLRAALGKRGPIRPPLQRAAQPLCRVVERGDRPLPRPPGHAQVFLGGPKFGQELCLLPLVLPLDDLGLPQRAGRFGCQGLGVGRRFEERTHPEHAGEVVLQRELALGLVKPAVDHDGQLGKDSGVRAELR